MCRHTYAISSWYVHLSCLHLTIQCESSINDGAGTPYWILPLLLITSRTPGKDFILHGILIETIASAVGGFALGSALRFTWNFCKRREWVDKESRLVWTLSLAITTVGLVSDIIMLY